jgi:hypothetical protein
VTGNRWSPGYFWPGLTLCHHDGCQNGFLKTAGVEPPYREKQNDYTPSEVAVIDRYLAWYHEKTVLTAGEAWAGETVR